MLTSTACEESCSERKDVLALRLQGPNMQVSAPPLRANNDSKNVSCCATNYSGAAGYDENLVYRYTCIGTSGRCSQ